MGNLLSCCCRRREQREPRGVRFLAETQAIEMMEFMTVAELNDCLGVMESMENLEREIEREMEQLQLSRSPRPLS
jgi:hypothetical protein